MRLSLLRVCQCRVTAAQTVPATGCAGWLSTVRCVPCSDRISGSLLLKALRYPLKLRYLYLFFPSLLLALLLGACSPQDSARPAVATKQEVSLTTVAAQAKGCRIQYGSPMLACQIELMADFMGAK